ncbi:TetR/AcrR family transcriptional regulator [Kitasatospora sp. NPDC048407]|uniref:TetR/AcrR family transcriptional regulator n=1 Tax=Kitasatospora sp. NPDC048407 TaxID=3364051 RepID=UPI003714AF37
MVRPPTPAKRPYAPRMAPAERREQLLDTALEIINRDGVAAVSVDAVAKAAGVTRPVVYGQFTDADHLLRALLEREGERAQAQIAATLPRDLNGADPVEVFTGVARGYYDAVVTAPSRWRAILLPVDGSPPAVRRYKERSDALVREQFAHAVRWFLRDAADADDADDVADLDVELLIRVLLAALEEGGRLVLNAPDEYPPERLTAMARFLVETFLHRYPYTAR